MRALRYLEESRSLNGPDGQRIVFAISSECEREDAETDGDSQLERAAQAYCVTRYAYSHASVPTIGGTFCRANDVKGPSAVWRLVR
jgi:hypothetical protein